MKPQDFHAALRPLNYNPPEEPLAIVYEDAFLLVFDKPSGLLSVPGKGEEVQDSLELRARTAFPEALLVHRLDMDTSGIFIMARSKAVQAHLGKQFERRKTAKTYIARVSGEPEADEGLIDWPLRCDWPNRPLQMICYEHGKPSQTAWSVLAREGETSLIELNPITGRSHQLRVHMAALGHPILGDCFYAPEEIYRAAPRLLLHAQSLEIHHPEDGRRIKFESPTPF